MKTAVVTPLTLLSNTLRSADSTLTTAPSLPWQSTCACDAISATHPLTSGTSPCDWRQSPWPSTHMTPMTPGCRMASVHAASMWTAALSREAAAPTHARRR
eukprot:CAMPEP_0118814090 /NCGR_PEP_ID=MMETSP1162-20130426/3363_1 /TAXON_ID=33656 /ORGANISM="Phaeocystis Sp, Strain CCMP2710" /LENGTH=100 /DNA_ID=CAMNT_0006743951 /DNA_START=211 /DNA_END=509 /DNA_ORIENTATION=+